MIMFGRPWRSNISARRVLNILSAMPLRLVAIHLPVQVHFLRLIDNTAFHAICILSQTTSTTGKLIMMTFCSGFLRCLGRWHYLMQTLIRPGKSPQSATGITSLYPTVLPFCPVTTTTCYVLRCRHSFPAFSCPAKTIRQRSLTFTAADDARPTHTGNAVPDSASRRTCEYGRRIFLLSMIWSCWRFCIL